MPACSTRFSRCSKRCCRCEAVMSSITSVNSPNGTVGSVNTPTAQLIQALVSQENQLQDLTRQLSTGQQFTDYAGIPSQAQLLVGLNSQLSAIGGFQANNNT